MSFDEPELIESNGRGLYPEQWRLGSMTGRVDKHGNPVEYKISRSREGGWSCSCGVNFAANAMLP